MSSGVIHDRAILLSCPVVAGAVAATTTLQLGIVVGISYLIGGLWLSPDLDIHSRPFLRWGYLKFLWIPYQKIVPHRSRLSHSVLLGTLGRVGYFMIVLFPFWVLGIIPLPEVKAAQIAAIGAGLELSAWCHLLLDKK
ncbi:MAG: metal-binding protein [Kastovskya adunca ATA6-11-RM4]|jgi:uncharacterized metal-binding protein|nr:metal-binding protein [Kastovskya adunca ATA6-11-RM4]